MTSRKQLKARVRARMARTGERYTVARAHLVPTETGGPVVDHGYDLTGGTDPDAAALSRVLAHQGVTGPAGPLAEPLLFTVTGGLGAGYILWEFAHDDSRHVTLGFSHSWNYLGRRLRAGIERLGLEDDWQQSAGAVGAARRLQAELEAGNPGIVWPDRAVAGYWQLPERLSGHGGHAVVAYAADAGRVHVDDRCVAPLTIERETFDAARARVGSYRNALLTVRSRDVTLTREQLGAAVRAGLAATVDHLGGTSTSFALPAWRKWSKLLTDSRNAKGWPTVFADGRALPGALLSVWEGIEPAGMTGGCLRSLFADGLEQAAAVLAWPALAAEAETWRGVAGLWHELAETALPGTGAVAARLRELTATVTASVAEGDAASDDGAAAARELWDLRARHGTGLPDGGDATERFTAMSERLAAVHDAERDAVGRLGDLLDR